MLITSVAITILFTKTTEIHKSQKQIYKELREFETLPPAGIVVENNTLYPINNTVKLIANKILKYDDLTIIINIMPASIQRNFDDNLLLRALIFPNVKYKHTYLILLAPDIHPENMNRILTHEAAHIRQYESGDLKVLNSNKGIYVYKQDTIVASAIQYNQRPFEIDANHYEEIYVKQLDSLLCE